MESWSEARLRDDSGRECLLMDGKFPRFLCYMTRKTRCKYGTEGERLHEAHSLERDTVESKVKVSGARYP